MNTLSIHKPYTAILRDKRRAFPVWSPAGEWLAVLQGAHHCLLGLWMLLGVHMLQKGIGPSEVWLAQSCGVLLFMVGGIWIMAAIRSVLTLELGVLMIGSSFGLGVIELMSVTKGALFSFHTFEAAEELLVMLLGIIFLKTFTHRRHSSFI